MAYGLKYYAAVERGGKTYKMNIYRRDYSGSAKIIGTLQALAFGYVGDQDIDSAVIKSELTFTLADCWREEDRYDSARKAYIQYGGWEEFYTSDALLYKVKMVDGSTVRWTGFLTPDSYEEDLIYGGSVSFVARDMIGHMGDFDFDMQAADGLLRIGDILDAARTKCGAAMAYSYIDIDTLKGCVTESGTEYGFRDWMVCQEAFEDKTYYEVVEEILDSFGMTMRWNDGNVIAVMPLRSLPERRTAKAVRFVTSGHRSLSPAVRAIRETLKYDIRGTIWEWKTDSAYFKTAQLNIGGITSTTYIPSPASPWLRSGSIGMWDTSTLDRSHCWVDLTGEKDVLMVSVVANESNWKDSSNGSNYLLRSIPISKGGISVTLSCRLQGQIWFARTLAERYLDAQDAKMTLHWGLRAKVGSAYYWLDNGKNRWGNTRTINKTAAAAEGMNDLEVTTLLPMDATTLEVLVYGFGFEGDAAVVGQAQSIPSYGTIVGLEVSQEHAASSGQFVTNTIYNEANNVIITRDPMLGQVPICANAHVICNGCYSPDSATGYPALQYFRYSDGTGLGRLSVLVHKALLLYHDRPGNELSGELIDNTSGDPSFGNSWTWGGESHLLVGGKLNVRSGRVDSSVLREVHTWGELWGGVSVSPTTLSVTAAAGTSTLKVTAATGKKWEITGLVSWLTASKTSGTGSASVTLTRLANPSYTEARSAVLNVGGVKVKVTQAKASSSAPTWDATDQNIDAAEQDVCPVTVYPNGQTYTMTSEVSWLHVEQFSSGSTMNTWVVSADANTASTSRSGRIRLKHSTGNRYMTVTQAGKGGETATWDATDKDVDAEGDSWTVLVTPNGQQYDVVSDVVWMSAELVQTFGATVGWLIEVLDNGPTSDRTGHLSLVSGGVTQSVTVYQVASTGGGGAGTAYFNPSEATLPKYYGHGAPIEVVTDGVTLQDVDNGGAEWLRVMITSEGKLYISTQEQNDSGAVRTTIVTGVFADSAGGQITATLIVHQAAE